MTRGNQAREEMLDHDKNTPVSTKAIKVDSFERPHVRSSFIQYIKVIVHLTNCEFDYFVYKPIGVS